jgi:hypothetical protein
MDENLVKLFADRFVCRSDCYAKQIATGGNWRYSLEYGRVTTALIADHLAGTTTLAFPAFDQNGFGKWLVWDADTNGPHIDALDNLLTGFGFHTVREGKRTGRDGHLWLLFDQPVLASECIRFEEEIRAHARIPLRTLEFFLRIPVIAAT